VRRSRPSAEAKRDYYSRSDVVRTYESRRFERGGGAYVARVETAAIEGLLAGLSFPPDAWALDCPSGTGRFLPLLARGGLRPLAVDISLPMLAAASARGTGARSRASASSLPLPDGAAHLWLMSRFAFHFADLRPFLREAHRVLVARGYLLLDVYHWTPRSWLPGGQSFVGGRVHIHGARRLESWLGESGLAVVGRRPVFALTPYLYGWMPRSLPPLLDRVGDAVAPRWKAKSYVLAQKVS
jgi:SAM-dependent methyltransferase